MEMIPLLRGMGTWAPGIYRPEKRRTGLSVSARYCYSVYLRHLALLHACGLPTRHDSVAELGPGATIGLSLMALLLGASRVEALDVVRYASRSKNARMLADLAELLRAQAPIPDEREFPEVYPRLPAYAFPPFLEGAAADCARLEAIAAAVKGAPSDIGIRYYVPWQDCWGRDSSGVDFVISQAALEHVEDIAAVHRSLAAGLRIGGLVSHVIDFKSHDMTATWDGHLQYGELTWRIVKGRRPYLLNRRSPADHLRAMEATGFEIVHTWRALVPPTLVRSGLPERFRDWSDEDRSTTTLVVLGRRIR
ncbi:MAG: hypothetical protein ACRES6_04585 [Steroidobacteraceae bacterium]